MCEPITEESMAFGPVPSRRLGRSLGINNIPAKTCSYSCVYCQLGKTIDMSIDRQVFYNSEKISEEVARKVHEVHSREEEIDYLTFVSEGEPTLDLNLGREISLLKKMGIPIAVLTNASLLGRRDVRQDLMEANLVSVKVDAVTRDNWHKINRPHGNLRLNKILEGITEFVKEYEGTVISETMIINQIDYNDEILKLANFLKDLKKIDKAYISVPTRPPAEKGVRPAREETLNRFFQVFSKRIGADKVEYLLGYEGNQFAFTGKVEQDLLSITAVHPMREEAIRKFLKKANAEWKIIEELLKKDKLVKSEYKGNIYYLRKLSRKKNKYTSKEV
ncbi:MAG: radical SAM protein [Thermoproteota archaeon]